MQKMMSSIESSRAMSCVTVSKSEYRGRFWDGTHCLSTDGTAVVMCLNDMLGGFLHLVLNSIDLREQFNENIVHSLFDCAVSTLVIGADNEMVHWNRIQ